MQSTSLKSKLLQAVGLAAFASILVPASAEARINTVQVTGQAGAVEGDRQASEEAAKRAARRLAVEEGAGVLVESNTIVRNFQMVSDEIATMASGVITDEQWGPLKIEGGVASISLTAKVSPKAVEDAICTVIKANHDPKITMVFVEKVGKHDEAWSAPKAERGLVEAMFADQFMDNCFDLVESGVRVTEVSANGDLDQATIDKIIENSKAQYILLGSARLTENPTGKVIEGTSMKSFSIGANVKLINVDTKRIDAIATGQKNVLALSATHAAQAQASREKKYAAQGPKATSALIGPMVDELFQKIGKRWSDQQLNAGKVSVTVKGVKNYKAAKDFRKGVEATIGGKVDQRRLAKGVAEFDVEVEGGADVFASKVDEKKFGKYRVSVLEVTPGKVVIELVK